MKKILMAITVFFSFLLTAQTTLGGVRIDGKLNFEGNSLTLNGAGIREKYFMDMYVGSLYLETKTSDAKTIISANEAMVIKLNIVSGLITSEKMITAVNEGFEKSTGNNTTVLKSKIDKFKSFFKEKITKGDIFAIGYVPNEGVVVFKNGTKKGTIEGLDFKKALFGIWLGNDPADKDLKAGMLGK